MSREFGYMLKAWQDDDLVPSYLSSFIITNVVVFEFRVTFPHEGEGNESNDDDWVIAKILTLKRECMLRENHARLHIVKLLSDIRIFVSTNSSIVTAIYSNAIVIANETGNIACPKILPIVLEIVLSNVPINDNDRTMREVTNNQDSICGFEKVELKNVDSGDECMICLEELSTGLPLGIIRSPCSHFYHYNCILTWIQRSSSCPICRSHIPVASIL